MENPRLNSKPTTERTYPVYAFGAPLSGRPLRIVDRERCDEMIKHGDAVSRSGGSKLQLTVGPQWIRGSSVSPTPGMMDAYVAMQFAHSKKSPRKPLVNELTVAIEEWPASVVNG
jgi:hypothetical protein